MDPISPRIPVGFDLLWLTSDVIYAPVLDVSARGDRCQFELNLIPYGGSMYMHWTFPRSPSRSAKDAMTCIIAEIILFDQLASCW